LVPVTKVVPALLGLFNEALPNWDRRRRFPDSFVGREAASTSSRCGVGRISLVAGDARIIEVHEERVITPVRRARGQVRILDLRPSGTHHRAGFVIPGQAMDPPSRHLILLAKSMADLVAE